MYLVFYAVDMLTWSAVLLPALLLIKYVSRRPLTWKQNLWTLILALYLAAVYNVAGAPELPYIYPRIKVNLIPFLDAANNVPAYIVNSGLNIILFLPLGFILPLLWPDFRSRSRMCLSGSLLSLGIELSQLLNFRITDVDDLIMNTLGTWLGYELVMFIHRRREKGLLIEAGVGGHRQFLVILAVVVFVMFILRPYITMGIYDLMF